MFATWIFAAVLFIQTVFALVHISKEGVTTKFLIEFKNKCKSRERKFTSLLGMSVGQCAEECGLRKHCVALNYVRRSNACELQSSDEVDALDTTGCIHIRASDIEIIQDPCGDCAYGQVCDTATKQCLIKDCPPGWESFNGSCYLFSKEFRGWEDSKAFCEYRKSNLVKVEDRNEDDYIRNVILGQEYLHYYWIGLRFDTTNNEFRWTDGSTVTFNGWGPDRPGSLTGCCNYLKFGSVTWEWNAHFDCVYTKDSKGDGQYDSGQYTLKTNCTDNINKEGFCRQYARRSVFNFADNIDCKRDGVISVYEKLKWLLNFDNNDM